ncbi:alpha/beta hydrolase family protein [Nocardiopsis lambiniae]|uniref:Alpha/beta hydrolase n=1 Tax=Nocardiopsis lambiniae TaxID=3075539 RepID=A0ABU2MH72_9ACTN|nr:alpha/beta hydrolase [Nocardiopsis sp. DSM 44743]MDT0331885.1 alpha/beta hydrolase [Nocardiopsis sp. DSM 44743]
MPFLALPPATGPHPAPLVLGLHAFEPPRGESALAGTAPMASLPAWRVYPGLPLFGARLPEGGVREIGRRGEQDYLVELFGPVVEEAAAELPRLVAELRTRFPITDGPVGLVGVGAGAAATLLALAEGDLAVGAAAVVNPVADPAPVIAARERHHGSPYAWNDRSLAARERFDFVARAGEVARGRTPMLVVSGGRDEVVPPEHGRGLHEALRAAFLGTGQVDSEARGGHGGVGGFEGSGGGGGRNGREGVPVSPEGTNHVLRHIVIPDLAHAIGTEPGLEPGPLTPAGVLVDRALTEWFHRHVTASAQVRDGAGDGWSTGGNPRAFVPSP